MHMGTGPLPGSYPGRSFGYGDGSRGGPAPGRYRYLAVNAVLGHESLNDIDADLEDERLEEPEVSMNELDV